MSEQEDRVLKLLGEKAEAGFAVLNAVRDFIARFCVFPNEHCLTAVTLWAAHTHVIKHLYTTARLAVLSPEVASGKTRVLEVLNLLVPGSLFTLNASPASIFRLLAQELITLLFDEVDAIWTRRGKNDDHEDLKALLNAGYKTGASIPRCVGPRHDVIRFDVFCAVALAGLGDLPETIMSRSVIIRMRRRAPDEIVEPFHARTHEPQGHSLRVRLSNWSEPIGEVVAGHIPELPLGIVDRPAEVWEPLLVIADLAGGEWPQMARDACVALCKEAEDKPASLGLRLLADIRTLFGDADAMHSATLVDQLKTDHERNDPKLAPDAPWAELYGNGLTQRRLASILGKKYEIYSTRVRVGAESLRGYRREDLYDTWRRYLPSLDDAEVEQLEQPEQGEPDTISADVPNVPHVPDTRTPEGGCPKCAGEGCKWCEHAAQTNPFSAMEN